MRFSARGANLSRNRADLPCESSPQQLCAWCSTSRQLRTARQSCRCVRAFAHVSAICHNGHRWKARRTWGRAHDWSRLGEASARTWRSLRRSRPWNTHAVNARLEMGRTPQSFYAKKYGRASPLALCAIPERRVLPFPDRSLDQQTPVLIVSDGQDAAILDSRNMLDPPRLRP